ncbi:MAG: translation initiation factor IF-2, partial [Tepidisphaeraceae bacterium]
APAAPTATKAVLPQPSARPTVRLERGGAARPERPATVATPFVPKPATLAGPKLVREEKPDIVSAPRKRLPPGQGPGPQGPLTSQTLARAGRGVRVAEDEEGGPEGEKKAAAKGKPVAARRRGPDGRRGEADENLREFSEADLKDRAERIQAASAMRQATDMHLRKTEARGTHVQARTIAQRGGVLEIEEPITVRSLSTELGVKSNELLGKLMKQGVFANINQSLDFDTAALLSLAYNVELKIKRQPTMEEILMAEFDARSEASTNKQTRPAVVTILGHVDHGKTSLLDKIRSASVAAGEAGGITQHIAAWQVQTPNGKRVTFIDTPGHQAFTAMRARGANMTDVVVLVVDAAQGIQPQTSESISHAKAAEVPIVVALNKIDRPDANPDMVLGQLAGAGLNPVEWGGDTEVVRTSAFTGQGIPELLEILDYQSELRELRADPDSPARGSVIEARMDPGLGPIATVLVQDGTLHVGDVVLSGQGWGKVRSLLNDQMKQVPEAGPSTPIIISSLSELPSAGDKFFAMDDLDRARSIAAERLNAERAEQLANKTQVSLDSIYGQMKESQIKTINLIVKADVQGSIETLQKTITDQNTDEVRVKVIHAGVGPISESDVELADASKAVIIGFHVVPDDSARAMAEQRRVEVRTYKVIYEIFDDLKKALSGMLEPETREKLHGHAEVRAIFKVSRLGNIAGCMVTDGHIQRGSKIRLMRDGKLVVADLSIETLKRSKDDVREVKSGFECGIKLAGYDDIKIGDVLEAYIRETFQRTL